jgi:hypothetical protein
MEGMEGHWSQRKRLYDEAKKREIRQGSTKDGRDWQEDEFFCHRIKGNMSWEQDNYFIGSFMQSTFI